MPSLPRLPLHATLVRMLVVCGVLVAAAPAHAALATLVGGRRVTSSTNTSPSRQRTTVTFSSDPALLAPPTPACPTASSLRIVGGEYDSGDLPLSCNGWTARGTRFRYSGAANAAGGVRSVKLGRGKLSAELSGAMHTPIPSTVPFVEVRLTVGPHELCGRFQPLPTSTPTRLVATGPSTACTAMPRRPNILLVYLDDTRADAIGLMPVVQTRLIGEGHAFPNAFTPNALCCPSRASVLTGLYSLRHGTRALSPPIGGASSFRELGADHDTIAVWLQQAGYRTGLFGKYLNGYAATTEGGLGPNGGIYVPPGWDRWWAMTSPEFFGGVIGATYRAADEDGVVTLYDDHTSDAQYSTDLSAEKLRAFVADAVADGVPFFAYWAPLASHSDGYLPPAPAQRHAGLLADLPLWRPPSWNEPDNDDKPRWIASAPDDIFGITDLAYVGGSEALLSVDEQMGLFLDHVESLGVADDTLIVFTSDNGVTWGEHGLFLQGKGCPHEECQRVPFVVHYPRLGTSATVHEEPVLNIDVAPTLATFAALPPPSGLDGQDMTPLLTGKSTAWRTDYLLEYYRVPCGDDLSLPVLPLDGDRVRLFYGDPRALPRPSAVFEFDGGDGVVGAGTTLVTIKADANQTAAALASTAAATVVGVRHIPNFFGRARVEDTTGQCWGPMWWEEVDQANGFEPIYPIPAYYGVRDVARGYTWVEYETGERELYDLTNDPFQLENLAADPAHAALAAELSARTAAVVAEVKARGVRGTPP